MTYHMPFLLKNHFNRCRPRPQSLLQNPPPPIHSRLLGLPHQGVAHGQQAVLSLYENYLW